MDYIFTAFEDIVEGTFSLSETKIDKKLAKQIEDLVKERIKPKQVQIEGKFTIATFEENGVAHVKKALIDARTAASDAEIRYLGAGQYKIVVVAEEYKDAEKKTQKSNHFC